MSKTVPRDSAKQLGTDEPPLDAPILDVPLLDTLIYDDIVDEYPQGLPFIIPAYADMATGDTVTLILNGHSIGTHNITDKDKDLPISMTSVKDAFNFTGKARIYYQVSDVLAGNKNASGPVDYTVLRTAYPAPDDNSYSGLAAPRVGPRTYKATDLQSGRHMTIDIPLTGIRTVPPIAGNVIEARFELRATTSDKKGPPSFYPVPIGQHTLTQDDVDNGTLVFTVPYASFENIDENIGRVYYSLYQRPYFEQQSVRAVVEIDVIAPHG